MPQVIERPNTATEETPSRKATSGQEMETHRLYYEDDDDGKGFFSWPPSPGLIITFVFLAALGVAAAFVFQTLSGPSASNHAVATAPAAAPATATEAKAVTVDPKETARRDDYASTVAKELHAKVPAYKNVKIFADNWAGAKSPTRTPQFDSKTRKGDNLMLVFLSPDEATAKGLADFTKSKAAQQAAEAGFAELQFVDPSTYCYAAIAPLSGVGPVKCGPR